MHGDVQPGLQHLSPFMQFLLSDFCLEVPQLPGWWCVSALSVAAPSLQNPLDMLSKSRLWQCTHRDKDHRKYVGGEGRFLSSSGFHIHLGCQSRRWKHQNTKVLCDALSLTNLMTMHPYNIIPSRSFHLIPLLQTSTEVTWWVLEPENCYLHSKS